LTGNLLLTGYGFVKLPGTNHYFVIARLRTKKIILPRTVKPGVDSPELKSPQELQFKIFSGLWAIAALFHMAHSSVFDKQLNFALLTLAAFYVILKPGMTVFLVFIILQLFDAFFRMPYTTNHWLFTAFVNCTILYAVCYQIIRQRSFKIDEGVLFKTFAPVVRIEIIVLYFFAVFHKLNSGFFSPGSSCATDLLRAQGIATLIPSRSQLFAANAYFTIFIESLIPLLLCFRHTRNVAILAGILFHCVLSYSSYNAFYDFSSMVFACYFLFADTAFSFSLYRLFGNLKIRFLNFIDRFSMKRLFFVITCFLLGIILLYGINKKLDSFSAIHLYFFWTLYSIVFTYCFIRFWIKEKTEAVQDRTFYLPHWSFIFLPVFVFLNGTSPYLGLKTENSYAMFSNLRTEGGVTNHFIIPAGIQVFDYQKEVVQIVSSSDHGLQKLAAEDKAMVLFEFKNYVHVRKPQQVEYLLNGCKRIYRRADKTTHELLPPNSYILTKVMRFRAFRISEPQPCAH
jgi:hypothetical protein